MVFRFYGFYVKPTASRKTDQKTFNGKKKNLTHKFMEYKRATHKITDLKSHLRWE